MTSFVIVIFMTMGAVSAAEPGRSWTNTNHPGGLPDFQNLDADGTSSISCYVTNSEQKQSLVNCPGNATKCGIARFDMTLISITQRIPGYFCAMDEHCRNASELCEVLEKKIAYPIKNCEVSCCETDGCNISK
ncbi:uncharacterized protein LOC143444214 [Clavelina lepadiformis]|uniref:uncharacterized protein LOC143444214 n=1 Tax=Clavelina lepadiformis TaxID=159417 RepID=UPI0040436C78